MNFTKEPYFSNKETGLNIIYNIGIQLTQLTLKIIGLFNHKIRLGVKGRKETFSKLKATIQANDKTLWFHCASLGEYEQGLPVFEELRKDYPNHKVIISFFSPSGYEVRKNSPIADVVVYLPLDTQKNAKRFLDLIKPELTIFVKYEIWPNVLNELKKQNRKAILISALFRKDQIFFKWYGDQFRKALFAFEHIFTQDEASVKLLKTIEYNQVTLSGDTRFDRVSNQLLQNNTLEFIEQFKQDSLCVVVGSSWPEDEEVLVPYINESSHKNVKYIIAPHNIKTNQIDKLKQSITMPVVCYSELDGKNISEYQVLILNTIGLLTKVYNYADIAYVGGAMGSTGLHNTLEAAVFGVPIIIGQHYTKFPEAAQMISKGGMTSISNKIEAKNTLNQLIDNKILRDKSGKKNNLYIKENRGAVIQILDFIRK
ncbi:3-deoxy-D-manno-octulosonic acid transferase [Mangrovimonas aestuarii]|uniref:3-deoxy-D-manno-octulosonic acid transferase n=1 Tax=Mangrovimonas aestuarii TaxID=3018443 RepID=UPI002377F526|nr:glycosyltransferase N-terminal domain-containing protein [Mangrovimonas aestuarii]